MPRFEIPIGWTAQAYRFALDPTPVQEAALNSHAGARNFVFNTMLTAVKANLEQRAAEATYGLDGDELTPCLGWSMPSLRGEWNRRKHQVALRADGTPWWGENSKEAYSSGCQALANALRNWSQSRTGQRNGSRMGFPALNPSAAHVALRRVSQTRPEPRHQGCGFGTHPYATLLQDGLVWRPVGHSAEIVPIHSTVLVLRGENQAPAARPRLPLSQRVSAHLPESQCGNQPRPPRRLRLRGNGDRYRQ